MDLTLPTPLLGGLTPATFMRRHWQKKPLLIRGAMPGGGAVVNRAQLFALAGEEAVESRLVVHADAGWTLRHGPFRRAAIPPLKQPRWTLLVQGMDLHLDAARALLERFRFVPDARLDDVMVSYASDGGGVGPHVDSYDVFLLQVQGLRRWRVGRVTDPALVPGVPLKILACFEPEFECLLEPGDMLYLPPGWGHDGVAEGECLTCSIGFRAAGRDQLARDVLQRALDAAEPADGDTAADTLYRDPKQPATAEPGRIPQALQAFAGAAVARTLSDERWLGCALGEVLSEPKPGVWFEAPVALPETGELRLDRRTRMLYDDWHIFVNGESYQAAGRDARLMHQLADERVLPARVQGLLSAAARELVDDWLAAGWMRRDETKP